MRPGKSRYLLLRFRCAGLTANRQNPKCGQWKRPKCMTAFLKIPNVVKHTKTQIPILKTPQSALLPEFPVNFPNILYNFFQKNTCNFLFLCYSSYRTNAK